MRYATPRRWLWVPAAALFLLINAAGAPGRAHTPELLDAALAWDRGDYPAALRGFLALLDAPASDDALQAIALETGEWFRTIELTPDGDAPRFSSDGRYFSYEVGRGVARRTRVSASAAPQAATVELPGHGAAFAPDGSRIAYIRLDTTPAMLALEAAAGNATGAARSRHLLELARLTREAQRIVLHDLSTGTEREIGRPSEHTPFVLVGAGDTILFTGYDAEGRPQVYCHSGPGPATALTSGVPGNVLQAMDPIGTAAVFTVRSQAGPPRFGVVLLPDQRIVMADGWAPALSADGRTIAYVQRHAGRFHLVAGSTVAPHQGLVIRAGHEPIDAPALSHDGSRIAFQIMPREDWELYVIDRDGRDERRVTREIQHDVAPRFLTADRIVGLVGEARHRRSYLYDLSSGSRTRLFHNNTVRTIAPEYRWVPSPDGTKLLVVAERDGDTVSPERGVYLVDLTSTVTREDLRARLQANLAAEEALRADGRRMFAPLAGVVQRVLEGASLARVYEYQRELFQFDSKHISRPGNRQAAGYLFETYKSFGYEPEYQWLTHRTAHDGETANVLATLRGTVNPELVYVVSSHFDSVEEGPGADDNSSGTAALLETARLLARNPLPATIVFASFTGEESGLLGSREFVRRAVAGGMRIAGALNNDMIGWANDHRLDSTIRYSNPGIRDIQHGAAIQFTRLITYDARYYKNTDAHAYYEAFGDIVGGIGSYPVLGNPHYHEPHDVLETINHDLVLQVAKTTTATVMLLASSPSRLNGLRMERYHDGVATISWTPGPERGIAAYLVRWAAPGGAARERRVTEPRAAIPAPPGTAVSVKAINQEGLEGWDWARLQIAP